jgi:hypothetical protein
MSQFTEFQPEPISEQKRKAYEALSVELFGEAMHYFSRLVRSFPNGPDWDQQAKGNLILTLHRLVAALETRPYDSGNTQSNTTGH